VALCSLICLNVGRCQSTHPKILILIPLHEPHISRNILLEQRNKLYRENKFQQAGHSTENMTRKGSWQRISLRLMRRLMRKQYFHSSMRLHNVALNSAQANFTLYRTKVYTTMENRHVHTHTHTHKMPKSNSSNLHCNHPKISPQQLPTT